MLKHRIEKSLYQHLLKPALFNFDAEVVHNHITWAGETLAHFSPLPQLLFAAPSPHLSKSLLGITFPSPIGLGAGFDYDGHLAKILSQIGFGFSTVGTVTAHPYPGNPPPRLIRLPNSQALLVNKGFKSEGAMAVASRLDKKNLQSEVIGLSVGSSNVPQINTITKAIDDYLFTFNVFRQKSYVKYFELNISCPNTSLTESFTKPVNLRSLLKAINLLPFKQPLFIKMPNEIDPLDLDRLIRIALKFNIRGYILSNLVKNRHNSQIKKDDLTRVAGLKGNFSGLPTAKNSKSLLVHARKNFGKNLVLISLGGIFTPSDALDRLTSGADLVQLVTGLIYEGPQLPGEINSHLVTHLPISSTPLKTL